MSKITITDANGKDFTVDLAKSIYMLNDDLDSEANAIFNSTVNNSSDPLELPALQIVNANGEPFSITDSNTSLDDIVDANVYIEASHSDSEINAAFYTGDSMMRDSLSYVHPFKKPMLKNHNSYSGEPLGRIIAADCIDSVHNPGTKALDIVVNLKDKDAIQKVLDERYKTVSIGARPGTITCNTCGNHILKDGKFKSCGHWRGQTYDGKKCTWKMEDLEYSELSFVNSPADKYAYVYKIQVNTKKDLQNKNSSSEEGNIEDDLTSQILNTGDTEPQTSDNDDNNNNDGDNNTPDNSGQTENNSEIIESLKAKIEALNNQLATTQTKLDSLYEENIVIKLDNELLNDKISKISNMYKDSLVKLVTKNDGVEINENTTFKEILDMYNSALDIIVINSLDDKGVNNDTTPTTNDGEGEGNINNGQADNGEGNINNTTDGGTVSITTTGVKTVQNPSLVNNSSKYIENDNNSNKQKKSSTNSEELNKILNVYA